VPRWLLALVLAAGCGSDAKDPPPATHHDKPPPADATRVSPAVAAIGDTSYLPPALQRAFDPAGDFTPMPAPGPGDWLAEHPERPQTFADFLNQETHVPSAERGVIYLLPIGEFPPTAPSLAALTKIVHAFFTLEVRVLPAVPVSKVVATTRINDASHKRQLLAPEVLSWLALRVPDDAFGLMAVTMEDLYPEPTWNFVFGMASFSERVGVQSFARQDPAFFGDARGPGWAKLALRRATWTMVHEISHMFGLTHCVHWTCVVAGSNSQTEADARPLHPCPVCLRKLQSAIKFDPAARETELAKVLHELGIDDEAAWSAHRAAWIRDGTRE
jgi:archaemetzincin